MKKKLLPMDIKVLTVLWKSSHGLNAFTLFSRLDTSFSTFSKVTRTLSDRNLITEDTDDFFAITQEGIALLTQINTHKKSRPWRDVPKEFLIPKSSTSDFYIPSTRLLDKKLF